MKINEVSSAVSSIAKRAKQNKTKHDALIEEIASLILNDKALIKHFQNSRLPRFVEKLTAYKGDITPSMLVTVSKILDDYYSGNVYKTKYMTAKQKALKKKYG